MRCAGSSSHCSNARFIFDSYANRKGKGTHRALDHGTEYCRRFEYVFQGDVKLFFPSIDHQILLDRLARRLFDSRVLALARAIVEHSNPQPPSIAYFPGDDLFTPFERRRGLPIGNLTSQFGRMSTLIRWTITYATSCVCRATSGTWMIS